MVSLTKALSKLHEIRAVACSRKNDKNILSDLGGKVDKVSVYNRQKGRDVNRFTPLRYTYKDQTR